MLQELIDIHIAPSHILQPAFGDMLVFNPTTDDLGVPSTSSQLKDAWILGAILSLCVSCLGYLLQRFSPLQWLVAMNNGDIQCISRKMLEQFAPDLLAVIDTLCEIGPDGSLEGLRMHFALYFELDVSPRSFYCEERMFDHFVSFLFHSRLAVFDTEMSLYMGRLRSLHCVGLSSVGCPLIIPRVKHLLLVYSSGATMDLLLLMYV